MTRSFGIAWGAGLTYRNLREGEPRSLEEWRARHTPVTGADLAMKKVLFLRTRPRVSYMSTPRVIGFCNIFQLFRILSSEVTGELYALPGPGSWGGGVAAAPVNHDGATVGLG